MGGDAGSGGAAPDVTRPNEGDASGAQRMLNGYQCALEAITDSICDFSNTQGGAGWYYGYFEPKTDRDFRLLVNFAPRPKDNEFYDKGIWTLGGQYWTAISESAMETNGVITTGERMKVEHWPVRRWVSTVDGTVRIVITVFRTEPNDHGNGVVAQVAVDGMTAWSKVVPPSAEGSSPSRSTIASAVQVGTTVDLTVDPLGSDDLSDETYFAVVIER